MKVPPMVPSAHERALDAFNFQREPDLPDVVDILATEIERAHRDGYAAGFAAALGMLERPNILEKIEAAVEASMCDDNDSDSVARDALRAAASALADSAGEKGE